MRGVTWVILALTALVPAALTAQSAYLAPDLGWSENRKGALGGRVGVEAWGGLDVVLQGLAFFPETDAVGDPGVHVSRSAWQANANVLYAFDRNRVISPYLGAGLRYGRGSTSVVVDGLRAISGGSERALNLLLGASLPRIPGRPFIEWKRDNQGWVVTGGAKWGFELGRIGAS